MPVDCCDTGCRSGGQAHDQWCKTKQTEPILKFDIKRHCKREEEGGHNYQVAGVFNCPTVIGARIVQLCSRCGKPNVVDVQTMRDDGQMPLPGFPIPEGKPS